MRIEEIVTQNL